MQDITADRNGLPAEQPVLVAGALIIGLAVTHFLVGVPSSVREWLLLAAMAMVAPALGYKAAVGEFDAGFAACAVVFTMILVVAGI